MFTPICLHKFLCVIESIYFEVLYTVPVTIISIFSYCKDALTTFVRNTSSLDGS